MARVSADVVLARSHAVGAEEVIEPRLVLLAGSPALDDVEHVAMEFAVLVSERGVVENSTDIIQDFMDRDIRMFPCEHDPWSYVLEDCGRELPCRLVENVGEMVFAEHAVGWIAAVWVRPGFVLVLPACVDDGGTPTLELVGYGVDDGPYERRQEREHEHC